MKRSIQMIVMLLIIVSLFVGCSNIPLLSKQTGPVTVERMWVGVIGGLNVELKPNGVVANKTYYISLYEKGTLRGRATVIWNQAEINVSTVKIVMFPISQTEYTAYVGQDDISNLFEIKIIE